MNKKQKNMVIGCVYKHLKHGVSDFTNNYITPLLDKLSNENKDIMIMGDFNINLKLVSAIFYQILIFSSNDRPLKTMKHVFYFI